VYFVVNIPTGQLNTGFSNIVFFSGFLISKYSCWYLRFFLHTHTHKHIYIYMCVCVCVISVLHSIEGQSILPVHLQYERFWFKNNLHRRVFAWRHLEAGQYMAQSGLHLHQSEPHSCKENTRYCWQELQNGSLFIISLISLCISFNKILIVHITHIIQSSDSRKYTSLISGSLLKERNLAERVKDLKNFQEFVSQQ
jgi:hypothetical protein